MKTAPHRRSGSTARATLRVVVSALFALAVLPPLLWIGVGALIEHDRAHASAASIAWLLDGGSAWAIDSGSAARLLRHPPFDEASAQRALLDAHGRPVAAAGSAAQWPALVVTRPLAGGSVEVRRSLRPLFGAGALVGLASCALVLALWASVFRRRLRTLRSAEQAIRSFATRDALTGLLNREGLRLALQRALLRCRGGRREVGLLLIDVDRFRLVNDSLGQPAGDQLLRSIADRIRAVVRDGDAVARLGADQFAVQVEVTAGAHALAVMARNLLRAFEPAWSVLGRDTVATLSIGAAVAGEGSGDVDALLKCAAAALRAAKGGGGARFRSYEPSMQVDDQRRLEMDLRLRRALAGNEFVLVFQPIMDAGGERIVAVEALLRWADPARGMVQPGEFIPVLEQTGLIVAAGNWVLRDACRQGLRWMHAGARSLVLSVNVSPRQFAEPDFAETVSKTLAETGFPAARLQLEVTEGLLLDPTPDSLRKIDALVSSGVRLAVDDFGMGYSSLAYLKSFPLHTLKIDRMFVRDIARRERDAAIVRAIVDLGHGLGLHVTAEGVESGEQYGALRALGCDSMQGFLFARPIGAAEMLAMLLRAETADVDAPVSGWSTTSAALLEA